MRWLINVIIHIALRLFHHPENLKNQWGTNMRSYTGLWTEKNGWLVDQEPAGDANWVLYFGTTQRLAADSPAITELRQRFPKALCCGCSTAGEILQGSVTDDSVVAVAVRFEHTEVRGVALPVQSAEQTRQVAADLARQLSSDELAHILVLSDGLKVNGSQLAQGFRDALPDHVRVTGGLAGDGTSFGKTLIGLNERIDSEMVAAIGFYGNKLRVSYGSEGGWESFGPKRRITRSHNNILYELDGQPALALYKRYLGDRAADLPATGLLYPLQLLASASEDKGLVRTILAVDEDQQSLTFAGDMPENFYARLMKTRHGGLISGAEQAGHNAAKEMTGNNNQLAVLVSCVGRRLVLGSRAVEELDAAQRMLGSGCTTIGFYSYGEICPPQGSSRCELHNQTMTITTFSEVEQLA
jgi:hypothetical protein